MKNHSEKVQPGELTRRQMIGTFGLMFAAAGAGIKIGDAAPQTLSELPYPENALEPVISSRTIQFHYGKHHQGYVANLNRLTADTPFAEMELEKIIAATAKDPDKTGIFNNAAQVWNHTFYWKSLKPGGTQVPSELASAIVKSFGSQDNLKKEFSQAAASQFGSGWAWLVKEGSDLKVVKTANAQNPMTSGQTPLLTVDVWEHAYYLDYQNRRGDYVSAILDKLLNWEFALENFRKN
jgi:Fe-Mn family superoxide dismutase